MTKLPSLLTLLLVSVANAKLMVWMCLEFCGDSGQEATRQLTEISHHLNVVSAVSFEKYTLGPDCALVDNNLTEVGDNIKYRCI